MKPSEEVHHISLIFERLQGNNEGLLNLIDRLRVAAIAYLKEITADNLNLLDSDQAIRVCFEVQNNPEYILYRPAATVLRTCLDALKRGRVDRDHIRLIVGAWSLINQKAENVTVIHDNGAKTGKPAGIKSGKVRRQTAEQKWALWQAEAEKIWKKHPTWKNDPVAKKVAEITGDNPGTIRKKIKKPLP
ncbi:MAG: hypothetical protein ACYDH8_14425 [Syntrophales bacterium]